LQAVPKGPVGLAALSALLMLGALYAIFVRAPIELQMGIVQKIFYFHVPSAYSMYIGWGLCVVGSLIYLLKHSEMWEDLAIAGAEVGTLYWAVVMVTGPLWARKSWGTFWTFDPRLTTFLLVGMIFSAYLMLRNLGATGEAERRFAAGLAVLGGALIPVIHYSVQLWRGQHPTVITGKGGGLHPHMLQALLISFCAFTALTALLIWLRARAEHNLRRLQLLELDAAERGLLEGIG